MSKLFEDFITESLCERLLRSGVRLEDQRPFKIADSPRFVLIPDLLVRTKSSQTVADCKYRGHSVEVHNPHVYQVVAYAVALGLPRAMLIYPATNEEQRGDRFQVGDPPIEVVRSVIDLGAPLAEIERACDRLAAELVDGPALLAAAS